jgi:hypothetical protein
MKAIRISYLRASSSQRPWCLLPLNALRHRCRRSCRSLHAQRCRPRSHPYPNPSKRCSTGGGEIVGGGMVGGAAGAFTLHRGKSWIMCTVDDGRMFGAVRHRSVTSSTDRHGGSEGSSSHRHLNIGKAATWPDASDRYSELLMARPTASSSSTPRIAPACISASAPGTPTTGLHAKRWGRW